MNQYFDEHFTGLKLQKPLFYNWPIGLRFEIGPDEIEIIYQQYSDGRKKIRRGNFIFKQIKVAKTDLITSSDVRNIYELNYKSECWKRKNIPGLSVEDVNYKNILLSLIHTDFSCRKPSMQGECYFINKTNNIILNLYDDRGMDVISSNKEALLPLYKSHNDWLLHYDREKMDLVFS